MDMPLASLEKYKSSPGAQFTGLKLSAVAMHRKEIGQDPQLRIN